jgi:hypothetical protein
MDFSNTNNLRILLLVIGVILAVLFPRHGGIFRVRMLLVAGFFLAGLFPAKTRELYNGLVSKFSPGASSSSTAGAGAAPAESAPAGQIPSVAGTPGNPGTFTETLSVVQAYMRKLVPANCVLSFLNWSDFSPSGLASAVTLRYQVHKPVGDDVFAAVRFTVQGGSVVNTRVIQTGLEAAIIPDPTPRPVMLAPVARMIDRFSGPLYAASHGPSMTLELDSAFSLAQLSQAKAKAQAEKKPLGFLMVWGQFFGHEADPQGKGSDQALVHYYEVFNQELVLVFVRHETELGMVPAAVAQGFRGPDEGGYAPNMAVTDATATEFITEIPYKALDGAGRNQLFAAGGQKIDQWMATHPDAMPTPAASP